ncbi:hypothetical protein MRX96_046118 [Rhipicephalus microplus]
MALLLGFADVVIFLVVVCTLVYTYASRKRNFWKNQNVRHEEFSLILGPAKRLLFKPMALSDQERYQKMGRLFGVYEGGKPKLVVAEPDLVKQVLVKDFYMLPNRIGHATADPIFDNMMALASLEVWRKTRPAVSPAFSTGKLRKMNALIQDCARVTLFYGHYSLDVIARCAFGTTLDSHSDATNEFVTEARKVFSAKVSGKILFFVLFPDLIQVSETQRIRRGDPLGTSKKSVSASSTTGGPMARNPPFDPENKIFDVGSDTKPEPTITTKRLTEIEAMAQCVLFFLAGLETTSSTLAFATYHLALNPKVQEKLRKEVDECMAAHGPEPSLDVISKLKYLHCVVSETLRLYPPAVRLERYAINDYVLGETGIRVPKNSSVIVPIYAMHRDPAVFPDPENFLPERFSDENVESIKPYTYLPFGAGPRNCIGMRLALQSVKLCLIHSLHNVQFVRTEKTKVPVKIKLGIGVLTAEDFTVGVRKRLAQSASDK